MKQQDGFTLLELIIALGIMGVILSLVINWQTSTLSMSTRTNAISQQVSELNDITGYMGDRVKAALRVRVATSNLKVNGNDCTTTEPCLAVVFPAVTDSGIISKYNLYVYRMEPRSRITHADDKVEDAWAETDVQILREYRSTDPAISGASSPANCTPGSGQTFDTATSADCVTMRTLATATTALTFSGFQPYLIADYLTPANGLGTGIAPFAYHTSSKKLTLAIQSKRKISGKVTYAPATPYTLTAQARNVP